MFYPIWLLQVLLSLNLEMTKRKLSYIASENCLANKIKEITLSYDFDAIRVFNISL